MKRGRLEKPLALERFVALLERWNRSINLVSRRDMADIWTRHIADSLQLGELWHGQPERAIDLGSGAGFPGLILAIGYGLHVDLIEKDQAKAAFLREAARVTGAPVSVIACRIEDARLPRAQLVTARGLAPLATLLEFADGFLMPEGACLFLKSHNVDAEIGLANQHWSMDLEKIPSRTDKSGVVLRIARLSRLQKFDRSGPA